MKRQRIIIKIGFDITRADTEHQRDPCGVSVGGIDSEKVTACLS